MSWWKDGFIFLSGLVAGKVINDSLPSLDVRPFFRKLFRYIGLCLLAVAVFIIPHPKAFSKTTATQIVMLVLILILMVITQVIKAEMEKKKEA